MVGATLKLWGGPSDSGCCSVADVDDARRVAQQLGIAHHVFNLADEFEAAVVDPYVAAHAAGRTPNPCIECNRHIKFDRLLGRAVRLGFDALATGHHARVVRRVSRRAPHRLRRGADPTKDQSYVLSMLGQAALARLVLPGRGADQGRGARPGGRPRAAHGGQARQPGRLLHPLAAPGGPGSWPDAWPCTPAPWSTGPSGEALGRVDAVELVTVGQRRGMGHGSRRGPPLRRRRRRRGAGG